MTEESTKLKFDTVDEVLTHFDKAGQASTEAIKTYRSQIQELTGHNPDQPVTALDVVKIVLSVFPGLRGVK